LYWRQDSFSQEGFMVASTSEIAAACQNVLATCCYRALAQIKVEERNGELLLHGEVRSFFMKQMAQVIIKPASADIPIVNLLEVRHVSLEEEIAEYSLGGD
jgi:hypothetical protein